MSARLEPPAPIGDPASPVHRLDARTKLVASVGITVVAVAVPPALWPVWLLCAAVLAGAAIVARLPPGAVWRRARVVLPLVLFVAAFLPFVREGETVLSLGPFSVSDAGLETFLAVSAKAAIGTLSAVVLGATTSFPAILDALAALRVPQLFVLVAQVTWRYLFVLIGEVERTRTALAARGYRPRSPLGAVVLGRAAGTLFMRAHARGERVHLAMLARGYEAVIRTESLTFAYPGREPALDGLTLDVRAGERLAILGPNGAGKTTLMLHLNGLLRGSGRITVDGIELTKRTAADVRRRVGLVFQDPDDQLFMPTVREDVAFGPRNLGLNEDGVELAVAAALAAVGMTGVEDLPPHALSLGQRRRVAIATVLAMNPEVLVLDEPSANLDPRARRELLAVLGAIHRTLLVVTHDLPFAAQTCSRAVVLSAGRIVADGPCRAILADSALLARHDLELPAGFALEALP